MRLIPELTQKSTEVLIPLLRRLDPYYRDHFDQWLRPPIQDLAQWLIRRRLKDEGLGIADEKISPEEQVLTQEITKAMNRFLVKEYSGTDKVAERAGNTKTYGLIKGRFLIHENLPKRLQAGIFRSGRSYPAYIRFAGPGPRVVPDIEDNGILSIGIKLMEVPGLKLLDDEKYTVDFSGISSPTFTTPNVQENLKLQREVGLGTPAWYFLNPLDSHYLDMVMQGLYARAHANPLELTYHSCVPYLFGNGKAVKFAVRPRGLKRSRIGAITDNYLRDAMVRTLSRQSVSFDFAIQFQRDPVSMPVEDASVAWSEEESPFISVATLEIPAQIFDRPAQHAFARNLTINPWHTLPAHRPLGNQNRARRVIYLATSRMRQAINNEPHIEPDGHEDFSGEKPVSMKSAKPKSPQKKRESEKQRQ